MAKKDKPQELMADVKRYKQFYRRTKGENILSNIWVILREYGFYLIPLFFAYLLIYSVLFSDVGNSETAFVYIILAVCILAVDAAAFFLVRLLRKIRFEKNNDKEVAVYKGNVWYCPLCGRENRLLAPCKSCGAFPILKKADGPAPKVENSKNMKAKVRKQYEEYTPQFK